MPQTVRDLIDAARVRHWSFTDVELGDGAALLFLNQRQRTHLANFGADIEGLIGETLQLSLSALASGSLVALDDDGAPFYATTMADSYPVQMSGVVPYINTNEPPIARDPFGESGGTPGFPLPPDLMRLINVGAVYSASSRNIPIDVIPERERYTRMPGRNPMAFIAGNRLVPVFPLAADNSGDRWRDVTSILVSYIALRTLNSLDDEVTVPAVLSEALVADLALLFARQSRSCDKADKAGFERDAERCAAAIASASLDMLEPVQQSSVRYVP